MNILVGDTPIDDPWRCTSVDDARNVELEARPVTESLFAIRQSCAVTWEAPIMYLIMGTRCAVLMDTGDAPLDASFRLRDCVDTIMRAWAAKRGTATPPLLVVHSHSHGDHVRGDAPFHSRPDTTVVGHAIEDVRRALGLKGPFSTNWLHLGGHDLLVAETPGHATTAICVVDPQGSAMLTGDNAYPGRLYVEDVDAMRASFELILKLGEDYAISRYLGCHIERSAGGREYLPHMRHHDDEAPLSLRHEQVTEIAACLDRTPPGSSMRGEPMSIYLNAHRWKYALLHLRGAGCRILGRGSANAR